MGEATINTKTPPVILGQGDYKRAWPRGYAPQVAPRAAPPLQWWPRPLPDCGTIRALGNAGLWIINKAPGGFCELTLARWNGGGADLFAMPEPAGLWSIRADAMRAAQDDEDEIFTPPPAADEHDRAYSASVLQRLEAACQVCGVTLGEILIRHRDRGHDVVDLKRRVYWLVKLWGPTPRPSYPEIAHEVGQRSHTTLIHRVRTLPSPSMLRDGDELMELGRAYERRLRERRSDDNRKDQHND